MTRRNLRITALILFFVMLVATFSANVHMVFGQEWSPDMRITWNAADDLAPSAAQALDGKTWFAWHSDRTGDYEIFYKVHDPTKPNPWSSETQLTTSTGIDIMPSVLNAVDNQTWITWSAFRSGNWDIYYRIFNGTSWMDAQLFVGGSTNDSYASLLQTVNGTIWLFWSSDRTGNDEIFLMTSPDNGTSWGSTLQVTHTSGDEGDPYAFQAANGLIWLVWEENYNIYYSTSTDGVSWSSTGTVTSNSNNDLHPSIAQATDGSMWAVWDSDRINDPEGDPQTDIFYRVYTGSWQAETQFTTSPEGDGMPSIMRTGDGNLTVTWSAARGDGLYDIYYRTTSAVSPHDVAIFYVSTSKRVVAQNRVVTIDVVAQNHGTTTENFNVTLYANTTLIQTQIISSLSPGNLYLFDFDWNTGSALGNYTITVNATVVDGETNTADNTYVDGTVWVVIHDVAVTGVAPSAMIGYQGFTSYRVIYVNVTNHGTISEDVVTVVARRNSTIIGIQSVTLGVGENVTLLFFFSTSSLSLGFYDITAEATPIVDEDHQDDNLWRAGTFTMTIAGDIDGNRVVDILDWSKLSAHWYPGPPVGPVGYDFAADVDEDYEISITDIAIMSAHWEQFW